MNLSTAGDEALYEAETGEAVAVGCGRIPTIVARRGGKAGGGEEVRAREGEQTTGPGEERKKGTAGFIKSCLDGRWRILIKVPRAFLSSCYTRW